MLEQLMGMIQENSQEAIVRNPQVPNQQNEDVMQTLMGSIRGGMQQEAQGGNVAGLMGLLSGKAVNPSQSSSLMSNPIVAGIAGKAVHSIMERFGMSNSAAGGIVASVLPGVISSLINKTSNSQDGSIDFNGILGDLMGGQPGGNVGMQSGGGGFDFNQIGYALADGKLDMNDLMRVGGSMMGGNNTSQQQGGMDLGGLLGGLFGK